MIARRAPIQRRAIGRKRTPARRKKRQSLSKRADALWAQVVKAPGRCVACGSTERLQAAHGISRRYRGTRWLPINGFCLCARHHVYWTHRPLEWDCYLQAAWGQPVYYELRLLALKKATPDFPAIIAALSAEVRV